MPDNRKLFNKPQKRGGSEREISLFRKRQQAVGIDWQNVEWPLVMQLLGICINEGIGVGFYPASGGRGVCMKLYAGKKLPDTEYANTAEELNDLLDGVIDNLGYKQEDGSAALAAD